MGFNIGDILNTIGLGTDSGGDVSSLTGIDLGGSDPSIPFITQGALDPGGAADVTSPEGQATGDFATGGGDGYGSGPSTSSDSTGLGSGGADTGTGDTTGGSSGGMQKILQGLGLLNSDGSINPIAALSLLGPLAGGLISGLTTQHATGQVVGGLNNATAAAQKLLGGPSPYAPYINAGQGALAGAQGDIFKPIASQFPALGTQGTTSLAKLAGHH